jgi:hypothetical protein
VRVKQKTGVDFGIFAVLYCAQPFDRVLIRGVPTMA